jgi:hypothetical protein
MQSCQEILEGFSVLLLRGWSFLRQIRFYVAKAKVIHAFLISPDKSGLQFI